MTNGEKYKTDDERSDAFEKHCLDCNGSCGTFLMRACKKGWLSLECEEEKTSKVNSMKTRERIARMIMHIGFVLGFIAGLILAYMIHVKWHFLGATFVQLQTVVALWSVSPFAISFLGGYIGALLGAKIVR